ncbi:MAG: hypothetical protein ACOWWM_17435 [Desulfobacterales bacterium]
MPEKKGYIWEIETLLRAYDEEIEKVRRKAASSHEPSPMRGVEADLVNQRQILKDRLETLKQAGGSDWNDLRLGVDNAREKLTMNLARAMDQIGGQSDTE